MTGVESLAVGVHLPQAGPAASGESLRRAAVLAEELGSADVWVSDHLVIPSDAPRETDEHLRSIETPVPR